MRENTSEDNAQRVDSVRQGRDTPCVGVCNTLYVDVCQGCGRTALEEAMWSVMSEADKDKVWVRLITIQNWKPKRGVVK